MIHQGQRVNVLTEDRNFLLDSGTVTEITQKGEFDDGKYHITLDETRETIEIPIGHEWRIELLQDENETFHEMFTRFIGSVIEDKKKVAIVGAVIVAIIAGILLQVKQHHASENLQVLPAKTQIQQWTDDMAALEREKAEHYERQKYLRGEDKKEVDAVKKIDAKIDKLKDKIHLYVKPSEDDS